MFGGIVTIAVAGAKLGLPDPLYTAMSQLGCVELTKSQGMADQCCKVVAVGAQ